MTTNNNYTIEEMETMLVKLFQALSEMETTIEDYEKWINR